jgi:hypothetical protein
VTDRALTLVLIVTVLSVSGVHAHDGPPFPIVSDRLAGPYLVSIWTDPDTTDDGSPGGQFWVRVHPAGQGDRLPADTRAIVTIVPAGHDDLARSAPASPVRRDVTNQFAAVVMDREGPFTVRVTIDGPLGAAVVTASVEATYDLRPPRSLLVLYLLPFVLVGSLWGRLLMRRRSARASEGGK